MAGSTIRAFIAAPLPPAVVGYLETVSQALAAQLPAGSVRWVKPQQMHLTLRFLGETALRDVPAIAAGLQAVAAQHEALPLWLDQLGCFPNRQRPRVFWVGQRGDLQGLARLKRSIDELLVPLGWEVEERPFKPHLTLGRVRDSRGIRPGEWEVAVEALQTPLTAVELLESRLTPSGPVYTLRHASRLGR